MTQIYLDVSHKMGCETNLA